MARGTSIFDTVKGLRPGKSAFDLSYEKKFTCDMGQLIPVMCDEVIPGDVIKLGMQVVVRTLPLAAPILHPIYMTTHYFFVPYRVLGDDENVAFDWETFITGGKLGTDATTVPLWNVTLNTVKSLWDYLGFPLGIDNANARPNAWPQYAYNLIWNTYYMDHDIDTELDITANEAILKARWQRDYFTTARPYQQRGVAPALPVDVDLSGTVEADAAARDVSAKAGASATEIITGVSAQGSWQPATTWSATGNIRWVEPGVDVPFAEGTATATSVDLAELRLSAAILQFMELSMRSGYRYTEYLQANYGIGGNLDSRLDRPEYIGGSKQWLVVSEVLQTSETSVTPQGTLVGHGMMVANDQIGSYRVQEHGLIMALFCIRPVNVYHQGIDRQWLRETRYDYYNPLFAGLSEQEILTREIYCNGANELDVFGYAPRFSEHRVKRNYVCGDMHADYDHWHLARQFAAAPTLGPTFLECTPRKDIFAATAEDGFMVSFGNQIWALRPIPTIGTPGVGRI